MSDPVYTPVHYLGDGKIHCKHAMASMMSGDPVFNCGGNEPFIPMVVIGYWSQAFEYLWRWNLKNGIEDLEKCRQMLNFMIEELEKVEKELCNR